LRNLLAKQLRSFTALFARALAEEDADTVHDLRVCTRRLQQVLAALAPENDSNKMRSVRRTLRRIRRALGDWRNCDVILQMVARNRRRTSNALRVLGWELVEQSTRAQRQHAVQRARRRLYKSGGITLNHRIQQLLDSAGEHQDTTAPDRVVRDAVANAAAKWQQALEHARPDRSVENLHALRIQGKRLRYRLELARDLGAPEAAGLIQWFKLLQDRLGTWHDREVLRGFVARAIAGSDMMVEQPRVAIELLRHIENDLKNSSREVEQFFHLAGESESSRHLEGWLRSYCASSDTQPPSTGAGLAALQNNSGNEPPHLEASPGQDQPGKDGKAQD
jgi:CHAD domain-containing protein